eukprot:scaffold1436_cov112-Cylindrotheca_fusiformis.AAC.3
MESPELGEVAPDEVFVYTRETKGADIPSETLTYLRVDSSVSEIPETAFKGCRALVRVQLPVTLTRIKKLAFYECYNLKCVQFVSGNESPDASSIITDNNLEDGTIVFPDGAKLQVERRAFGYCRSLRKVILCSVSTRLGFGAFTYCNGLISVELPEGLQVIEQCLFEGCESLATVKIPSSVIKIGGRAFYLCRSVASFDFPHGLVEIGYSCFFGCDSIETLHIPTTVSKIGERAFGYCSSLIYITLPPTLETIEIYAFEQCQRLEYIEFPTTLERIGSGALSGCTSLSHIRIPPRVNAIGNDAFIGCTSLISIELPEGRSMGDIDLSRCLSLVNFAGPMLNVEGQFMGHFMQISKLGKVAHGYTDLVHKLQHRFDGSPLNKLCYYQSYHSSEDAMVQLRSLMDENPLAATTEVDKFGMTPLHILSLSQTSNLDMLLAVMKGGHLDHLFRSRDSFGSTPMDYLCLNRMPNSSEVIRRVFMARFDELLGLERPWKSDMLQAVDNALNAHQWFRRREIVVVCLKLASYEREEILSLVELCLWKIKIEDFGSEEEQIANRETCRINSGASIVIPHVLPFLAKLDVETYFARSP